ncbi:Enoyl-CoA hydratase [Fimbriiglobus ruber]|uniref:Enoyl-CoA hydratase n=1 Tax=Fimbriiglobus ruber TaxID=1908690 RepID=A0A225DJD4_9BACT|nr:Enoyl-CoA hydratase [Fimbriiglobus ruber]
MRVTADDGIATLWLEFPGTPVNALSPARLVTVARAVAAVSLDPHVEILVIRSGKPAGFCGGYDPAWLATLAGGDDPGGFAAAGQQALNQLAAADLITLAFVEGPCTGPGLELALACDYRLAVAGPDSVFGFPDAARGLSPHWGGTVRSARLLGQRRGQELMRTGAMLSAREAAAVGLVDEAFCARRAKIALRTFLDRLQRRPRKRRLPWRPFAAPLGEQLAAERRALQAALSQSEITFASYPPTISEVTSVFPELTGVIGEDDHAGRFAAEVALRGTRVVVVAGDNASLTRALVEAVRRGRATPLEADQARNRVLTAGDFASLAHAGFVVVTGAESGPPYGFLEPRMSPHAILGVPLQSVVACARLAVRPGRVVGIDFPAAARAELATGRETTSAVLTTAAAWVERLGMQVALRAEEPSLPARRVA